MRPPATITTQWAVRLLLTVLLFAPWATPAARGQTPGSAWTKPILLSYAAETAWFPDIAADLTGRLHVVYASTVVARLETYDAVLYTTSEDGIFWTEPIDIFALPQPAQGETAATRPTLYVDRKNNLHASFTDYFRVFYSWSFAETAQNIRAWAPLRTLGSGATAYFTRVGEDSQGRLHYIYTENLYSRACPICYHVYHRFSDDNGVTWSTAVDVSQLLTGAAKPQLLIDKSDNLHIVWDSGRGGSLGQLLSASTVHYAASYDRGVTWSEPLPIRTPVTDTVNAPQTRHVSIGEDGRGQLVLVWLSLPDDRPYYQLSGDSGRSWTSPQPIPGVLGGWGIYASPTDTYSMASDSAGNVHLAMVGRLEPDQEPLDLIHLVWNGSEWSKPDIVTRSSEDWPEWPRLAVKFGNQLQLVWFTRNQEAAFRSGEADTRYQVWYAQSTTSAPELKPVVPTRAPTPVSTPTLTPTPRGPTPTVTTTRPAITPGPPVSFYRESDYLSLAAFSVIPVVALLAVVLIINRVRRG